MSGTFTHRTGRGQQGFDTGAHEALQNQDLGDGTFEETHNIGSTTRSFDINVPPPPRLLARHLTNSAAPPRPPRRP